MKKAFKKFKPFGGTKAFSIVLLLIIAIAIPLTVVLSQNQQDLRQHAASCLPRPSCLDAKPPCLIAMPDQGWCPRGTIIPLPSFLPRHSFPPFPSIKPKATCLPRPACLNSTPRCMIAQPLNGWCQSPKPSPRSCAQVITPAKNSYSGQCFNFPTSCIPSGWVKVTNCSK